MELSTYGDYLEEDYDDGNNELGYADYGDLAEAQPDLADSFFFLWSACALPSLAVFNKLTPIFLACFAVFGARSLLHYFCRPSWVHLASATAGLLVAYHMLEDKIWIVFTVGNIGYAVIWMTSGQAVRRYRGVIVSLLAVFYSVSSEILFFDPTTANKIRGCQMVFLMKLISLAFREDTPSSSEKNFCDLSFQRYVGYIFFPGNNLFGPWVSYETYFLWSISLPKKNLSEFFQISKKIFRSLSFAVFCLLISNCFLEFFVTNFLSFFVNENSRWLRAFQVAASFRFSHYFVCFLSETTLTATGFFSNPVTKVWKVEMPRSLVEVVSCWNIPMRNWLRQFVFMKARMVFSVPCALFLTYSASSLLHGVNFQLSAVLLTLSLGTYAENELRRKLALIFDACIEARPCRNCRHTYNSRHAGVMITNTAFTFLAMLHLAYLGDMFDVSADAETGYSYTHTLAKWAELDWIGHYLIVLALLIQYLLC